MAISGIYAITNNDIFSSENVLTTGSINIELNEYMIENNNNEKAYDNYDRTVFPGNTVSLIPKVENLGASCYIRAKVTFKADNDLIENNNNYLFDITDNWIKRGNYYYYKDIVDIGEKIQIFNNVKIPTNLPSKYNR